MSALWVVLGMGAGVYALRLSGLALRDVALPPVWERALGFVPIALLTALVLVTLDVGASGGWERLLAAGVAGLIAQRTGRMWTCILGGMVCLWLFRLV